MKLLIVGGVAMKIIKYNVHLHPISVHFTSALYPAALCFLILSYFYHKEASLFAYFHLMILATCSTLVSQITGIIEWKQKYKGAKVRIFTRKYRLGLVLLGLGISCTLWYGFYPEVLENVSELHIVFLFLNFAVLLNIIYLGYLGGRIVYAGAH